MTNASSLNQVLGFRLDCQTFKPSLKNIDKIKEFPTPTTRKLLQRFLGLANYNRRFIKRYSDLCKPLNKLTSSKVPFVWTSAEQRAFEAIRDKFHETLSLHLPDLNRDFVIKTAASKVAVGSVLGQTDNKGNFYPIGYHSETLPKTIKIWSATDQEMYAIFSASRKWKTYCHGSIKFITDHQPLKNIRKQKDPRGKIGRWILELENLDYIICYAQVEKNFCMTRI